MTTAAPKVGARYWEKRPDGSAACHLCPHHCIVKPGKTGICMAKTNEGGELIANAYGLTTSLNLDPMEKKPLYHFHPGTEILSIGPNACNLGCRFCQNFQISQQAAPTRYLSPEALVLAAQKCGGVGVAYTYSEPLMWYEYLLDACRAVKEAGMVNVLVSNGHLQPEPYDELLPLIDALNIDIKSMDETFYRKTCKGWLAPVLRNVAAAAGKAHIEITNLVIPTLNDADGDFEKLARFVASVDPFMPLHFSRYRPMYKMDIPATPVNTLIRAARIAKNHLKYVFIGNADVEEFSHSLCPFCGHTLIERHGYSVLAAGVKKGHCLSCGEAVKIVG